MSKSNYHDVRRETSLVAVRQEEPAGFMPVAGVAYETAQIKELNICHNVKVYGKGQ